MGALPGSHPWQLVKIGRNGKIFFNLRGDNSTPKHRSFVWEKILLNFTDTYKMYQQASIYRILVLNELQKSRLRKKHRESTTECFSLETPTKCDILRSSPL